MKLKKLIIKNWPAKLTAFLAAFLLWFFVAASQSSVTPFPGDISITFRNLNEGLVAIPNDETVKVKINADAVTLKNIREDNFEAYIDLAGLKEGTYEKQIQVVSKDENVQIVSFNPTKTTVRVEKKTSKSVPARVRFDGSVAEGYVASDTNISPAEVTIEGPESQINSISEAVAPIKLNGEDTNFQKTAQLFVYTANGKEIKNIIISPSSVNVEVIVSQAGEAKTVGIKVNFEGNVAPGYWLSFIKTDPEVVTISGSRAKLAATKYLETESVNVSNLQNSKVVTAKLVIPSALKVEGQTSSVKVTIEVSRTAQSKNFDLKPNFKGLASNLKALSDPDTVTLTLSGSQEKLDNTKSEDISLNINLSGLGEGTFQIDLKKEDLSYPSELDFVSFSSDKIQVIISKK